MLVSCIILVPLTSSHRSLEPVVCCAFGLPKGSSPLYPCVVPLGNDSNLGSLFNTGCALAHGL